METVDKADDDDMPVDGEDFFGLVGPEKDLIFHTPLSMRIKTIDTLVEVGEYWGCEETPTPDTLVEGGEYWDYWGTPTSDTVVVGGEYWGTGGTLTYDTLRILFVTFDKPGALLEVHNSGLTRFGHFLFLVLTF